VCAATILTCLAWGGSPAHAQSGGAPGEPPRPTASFQFSPANPTVGETVTFTSTSQPAPGEQITKYEWALDNTGGFDDFDGPTASWSFGAAGTYVVRLRVRQSNGRQAQTVAEVTVTVPSPPTSGDGGTTTDPGGQTAAPTLMSPFPVIRIAGTVLPRGARVRILSVRSPRGARIRARCGGSGCPVRLVARTSRTGFVRLRRFERRLRAGITIEIFVRRAGRIGKYTRFLIRAGRPPARVDRCLIPGRTRPVRCG
jgi:hypothetical protein